MQKKSQQMNESTAEKKDTLRIGDTDFLSECRKMLDEGQTVLVTAKGGSMFPLIHDGDKVLLEKTDSPHIGDAVLALTSEGKYVLHRIVGIEGEKCTLRGDANLVKTESCLMQDIAGAAAAIIRDGRTIICNSRHERLKVRLWEMAFPFRRVLLRLMK